MATLNELAYNIINVARNFQGNSDDDRLSLRQVKFWIRNYRAKGIFDITEYGKEIDPQLVQDLGTLKLSKVDKTDTFCPPIEWGCKILKVEIPKIVDLPHNRGLVFVGLIDKQTPFVIDFADVSIFKRATKFGSTFHRCYFINNTLYVVTKEGNDRLKYINVRGVFENPEDVNYYDSEGNPRKYNSEKDEYPMPIRLNEFVTRSILQTELNIGLQTINDEQNDARDNARGN
jgi:hypothetical protein